MMGYHSSVPVVPNVPAFQISGKILKKNGKFMGGFKQVEQLEQMEQTSTKATGYVKGTVLRTRRLPQDNETNEPLLLQKQQPSITGLNSAFSCLGHEKGDYEP